MKITEIRKMTTKDLTVQSTNLSDEIVELRQRLYSGEIQNVRAIRNKRKDLARILTVLQEQLSKEDL